MTPTLSIIILTILGSIAYGAMTFFACSAYFTLRKEHKLIVGMSDVLFNVFAVVSAMKLQGKFEQIESMKRTMQTLVDAERYEEAQKLQTAIAHQEKEAMESLKTFNETFGHVAEVNITKIN